MWRRHRAPRAVVAQSVTSVPTAILQSTRYFAGTETSSVLLLGIPPAREPIARAVSPDDDPPGRVERNAAHPIERLTERLGLRSRSGSWILRLFDLPCHGRASRCRPSCPCRILPAIGPVGIPPDLERGSGYRVDKLGHHPWSVHATAPAVRNGTSVPMPVSQPFAIGIDDVLDVLARIRSGTHSPWRMPISIRSSAGSGSSPSIPAAGPRSRRMSSA